MHNPRHVPVGAQERDVQQTPSFPLSTFHERLQTGAQKCDMQQYEQMSLILTLQIRPRVGSQKCDVQHMHSSCTRTAARLESRIAMCNSNRIGNATLWQPIQSERGCDSSSIYPVVQFGIHSDVKLIKTDSI